MRLLYTHAYKFHYWRSTLRKLHNFSCVSGFLLLCQYNLLGRPSFVSKEWKVFYGLFLICWGERVVQGSLHLYWKMIYLSTFYLIWIVLQGPLAWALIVWRCSLVFSSLDKLVSVLIHLLPGKLNLLCLGGLLYTVPLNNDGLMILLRKKKKRQPNTATASLLGSSKRWAKFMMYSTSLVVFISKY